MWILYPWCMRRTSSLNFWPIHHSAVSLYELLLHSASLERPTHLSLMTVIYLQRCFRSRTALSELAFFSVPSFSPTNAVYRVVFNHAKERSALKLNLPVSEWTSANRMRESQPLSNMWSCCTHVLYFHVSEQDAERFLLYAAVVLIPSGEISVRLLSQWAIWCRGLTESRLMIQWFRGFRIHYALTVLCKDMLIAGLSRIQFISFYEALEGMRHELILIFWYWSCLSFKLYYNCCDRESVPSNFLWITLVSACLERMCIDLKAYYRQLKYLHWSFS